VKRAAAHLPWGIRQFAAVVDEDTLGGSIGFSKQPSITQPLSKAIRIAPSTLAFADFVRRGLVSRERLASRSANANRTRPRNTFAAR
jgi:hypothetical protein